MEHTLDRIIEPASARGPVRLAVAVGTDAHTIDACARAAKAGIATPIIYGSREGACQSCAAVGADTSLFRFMDIPDAAEALRAAVLAVAKGEADVLMKGLVSTDRFMRAILNKEAGLFPQGSLLSHVAVFELPGYPRLLTIGDAAVVPAPDFKQKKTILGYLASTARSLGVEVPKIALIAPSEQVLPSVTSSTEGAILAKMADRGQLGKVIVDGPLSLDVSLYPEAAEEKKVRGSEVAGRADCLLFPNIESANVFYKSATHMADAKVAAMVLGTRKPVVLSSRGDSPQTKVYSIALAALNLPR